MTEALCLWRAIVKVGTGAFITDPTVQWKSPLLPFNPLQDVNRHGELAEPRHTQSVLF